MRTPECTIQCGNCGNCFTRECDQCHATIEAGDLCDSCAMSDMDRATAYCITHAAVAAYRQRGATELCMPTTLRTSPQRVIDVAAHELEKLDLCLCVVKGRAWVGRQWIDIAPLISEATEEARVSE